MLFVYFYFLKVKSKIKTIIAVKFVKMVFMREGRRQGKRIAGLLKR